MNFFKRCVIFSIFFLLLAPIFSTGQELEEPDAYLILSKNAIKQRALDISRQVEIFLEGHPDFTVSDLINDSDFQGIAVQPVGKTGYTFVYDYDSMVNLFHKNKVFIGLNYTSLKDEPGRKEWWDITEPTMYGRSDAEGVYFWKDPDGVFREKYKYTRIIQVKTADGVGLALGASTYLDEYDFTVSEDLSKKVASEAIKDRAVDVANQIDEYLRLNPGKTLSDLQKDDEFQSIAIQRVGNRGYTAVTDYDTLTARFHSNNKIVDLELESLSENLPGFWKIMEKTRGGREAFGFYDWEEANGSISKKYMHIAIVKTRTSDDVGLHVAATTYIEDYLPDDIETSSGIRHELPEIKIDEEGGYAFLITRISIVFLIIFILLFAISIKLNRITIDKNNILMILGVSTFIITFIFIINAYSFNQSLSTLAIDDFNNQRLIETKYVTDRFVQDIRTVATTIQISSKEISDERTNNQDFSDISLFNELQYLHGRLPGVVSSIYGLDNNGVVIQRFPYDKKYYENIHDYSKKPGVADVIETPKLTISKIFKTSSGVTSFSIVSPIFDENYSMKNMLRVNIPLSNIAGSRFTHNNSFEHEAHFLLIDGILYDSNQKEYPLSGLILSRIKSQDYGFLLVNNLDFMDAQKYHYLHFYNFKISGLDGAVVTLTEEDVPLKNIQSNLNLIWTLMVVMILVVITLGFIFARLLTKALSEEIEEKTGEVEQVNKILVDKVSELEKTRTAVLNMIDDIQDAKMEVDKKVQDRTSELNKAYEELKEMDQLKDDFLAITSHELKTPLTSIIGLTELLQEDLEKTLDADQKEDLEIVLTESKRLKRLIEEILELARLDAKKHVFEFGKVDLGEILDEIEAEIKPFAMNKDVKVKFKKQKIPPVWGDSDSLQRLILNLVNNAVKYSSDVKGHVTVSTKEDEEHVTVIVKDTGVGIPKEKIPKLFERFFQVDSAISRKQGGTGLGLSICEKIAEAHETEIMIKSEVGKGSTFSIPLMKYSKKKTSEKKVEDK